MGKGKKPYAYGTRKAIWIMYLTVIQRAHRRGLCPDVIPDVKVPLDTTETKRIVPLTLEQKHKFLTAFWELEPHYAPFVEFLFGTGVRIGEARALQVGDFNPRNNRLTVARTWSREKGSEVLTTTKNGKDRRFPVAGGIAEILKKRTKGRVARALIFTTAEGRKIGYLTFLRTVWTPVAKSLGLDITPHFTRHQFASEMIMENVHLRVIREFTGHSSTEVLEQVYAHVLQDSLDQALEKVAAWQFKSFTAL
jgi:integrase